MGNYFVDFYIEQKFGVVGAVQNTVIAMLVPLLLMEVNPRNPKSLGVLALHMLGCAVVMLGLNCLYYLIDSVAMPQVCGGLIVIAYAFLFCRRHYGVKTLIIICISFFSVIANVLVACFSIGDLLATAGTEGEQIIVVLLSSTMLTACVLFFRAFSGKHLGDAPVIGVALVGAAGAGNVVFWILTNVTDIGGSQKIVIATILILLLLMSYYGAYSISRNLTESNKKRAEKLLRDADKSMLRMSESNLESLRKLRHELKNQYTYMKVLLERKEFEKLDAHFAEYSDKLIDSFSVADCGNHVINAIVNIEKNKAEQAGINIEYDILVPSVLGFADTDLCSLLLNLLNNAIEYLERNPNMSDRTIRASIKSINKTMLVTVSNPIDESDREEILALKTSKRDKSLHGYGSKVIRSIVTEYNGSVKYAAENGRFIASAMMCETNTSPE